MRSPDEAAPCVKWRFSLGCGGYLTGALLLACGAVPPIAGASTHTSPQSSSGGSSSTASAAVRCETSAQCPPPPSICQQARCVAGACVTAPKAGPTSCELTVEQRRHHYFLETKNSPTGVCRLGACIPRLQCAELCGGDLGLALGQRLDRELDNCVRRQTGESARDKCVAELLARADLQTSAADAIVKCLLGCDYPEMNTVGDPSLAEPTR
jgi:hypothetical protein